MKKSGILLPVSALPSNEGIGDFGTLAFRWIDILKEANVSIWQILPLNPIGDDNSPYKSYSSYAGDEIYISIGELYKEGYLKEMPPPLDSDKNRVNYSLARDYKQKYLIKAFRNFQKKETKEENYISFCKEQWLVDYIGYWKNKLKKLRKYMELKEEVDYKIKEENYAEIKNNEKYFEFSLEEYEEYLSFVQFIFFKQWNAIKSYANSKGIQIMGDMPFYISADSADVWAGAKNFLLDKDNVPTFIAGVPPDYFSETGQRWGNPIYNWEEMKNDNFSFWTNRMEHIGKLFDIVRVDHFRAFDTYWKIPAECETAIDGEWVEAPGYEVMGKIKKCMKGIELVAEDLGDLREEVFTLKEHFGLKGMKIFEFDYDFSGKYLRDTNIPKDWKQVIYYTGTHDNATLLEWYFSLSKAKQRKIRNFLKERGYKEGNLNTRIIHYILDSQAEYAIISMPDLLEQSVQGRMNLPGTEGSPNWEWKMPCMDEAEEKIKRYHRRFARNTKN